MTIPLLPNFIAAWSALPPRVPTNHSPSPQKLTNWRGARSSPFRATAASAVATTSADDELMPAATGMLLPTARSMPASLWWRNSHLEPEQGRLEVEAPVARRPPEPALELLAVDAAHPVVPVELADEPAERDRRVGELVGFDVADLDPVVGPRARRPGSTS